MHPVEPKIFLVAETIMDTDAVSKYLKHINTTWLIPNDREAYGEEDGQTLIELMGRLCYRSFEPGLNPNVKKIREDSKEYLNNILKSHHGSVLEHANVSFIFADVSRVFTHELVRHRVGTAISQESLRYVRLEELGQWLPKVIHEHPTVKDVFEKTFCTLEVIQKELVDYFDFDRLTFDQKKEITSALRRLAPMGLATTIGWTANFRTLRHVIEMRTASPAEEEMRFVFNKVGELMKERYPKVFGDFVQSVNGQWITPYSRV